MLPAPYYQSDDGTIVIYHGDCLAILPELPSGSVDLVFTSPPYNLGTTTGGRFPSLGHYADGATGPSRGGMGKWARASAPGGIANGYDTHSDAMPHDKYVAWQHDVLRACWLVLADDGAIFYNHKPRILGGRLVSPLDYNPDLPVRQVVIWARAGGINFSSVFYLPKHEWIVILAKDDWRLKSKGASGAGDVWYIPQEQSELHPCPFPMKLPMTAIETTDASTILDPFLGSGTTAVACIKMGRKCIGIELSEAYCAIAARRCEEAFGSQGLYRQQEAQA